MADPKELRALEAKVIAETTPAAPAPEPAAPENWYDAPEYQDTPPPQPMGFGEGVLARGEALDRGATFGIGGQLGSVGAGLASSLAGYQGPQAAAPGLDAAPLQDDKSDFRKGYEDAEVQRKERAEKLGIEGAGWELAGGVAAGLATGGASLGAKALAMAPAALVEQLGAKAAAKVIGEGAAAKALTYVAGRSLGGAIEGGISGGLSTATEVIPKALENPGGAAEDIALGTLYGAGAGAVLGGGFGLVEGVSRAAGQKLVPALEDAAKPVPPVPPVRPMTAAEAVEQSAARPLTADQLPSLNRSGADELFDMHHAVTGGAEAALEEGTRVVTPAFDRLRQIQDEMQVEGGIALKRAVNDDLLNGGVDNALTDVIDEKDAAAILSQKTQHETHSANHDAAQGALAEARASHAAALEAESAARQALDDADKPSVRKAPKLVDGVVQEVDRLARPASRELRPLRDGLKATNAEAKTAAATLRQAEEAAAGHSALKEASKAALTKPIDTSEVVPNPKLSREIAPGIRGDTFEIPGKGSVQIDQGDLPGFATISKIQVDPALGRQGVGTKLYAKADEFARANGLKLASDVERAPAAESWWAKQVAQGKAHFDADLNRYVLESPLTEPAMRGRKLTKIEVATRDMFRGVNQGVDAFSSKLAGRDLDAAIQLKRQIGGYQDLSAELMRKGDYGGAYNALDQGLRSSVGDFVKTTKSKAAFEFAKEIYKAPQGFLEDAATWGAKTAEMQKLLNDAKHGAMIASEDAGYKSIFHTVGEEAADGWGPATGARSSTVRSTLSQLGTSTGMSTEAGTRRAIRANLADASTRAQVLGEANPRLVDLANEFAKTSTHIEDVFDNVSRKVKDLDNGKQWLDSKTSLATFAAFGAAVAGMPAIGIPAVGARWLLSSISKYRGDLRQKVLLGAAKIVKQGVKWGDKVGGLSTVGVGRYIGAQERADTLKDARETLDLTSKKFGQLAMEAKKTNLISPGLGDSMLQHKLAAAQYIQSKLPKTPSAAIFSPAPRLSNAAATSLDRTIRATMAPTKTFDRLLDGVATPEDMDAMRQLYPQAYQEMTNTIVEAVKKNPRAIPSTKAKMYLSRMTGQPLLPALMNLADIQARAQAATAGTEDAGKPQGQGDNGADGKTFRAKMSLKPDDVYGSRADQVLTEG